MEFEKSIQGALKTLRTSLEQHESQKVGYERVITRLASLQKSVPPESKLPLGEIVGILRRSNLAIQDFSALLSLDLRTPLSVQQVIGIINNAKTTIENQIGEIHNEIKEAEGMSILNFNKEGKEVLNEEGLPIRDIQEAVGEGEGEEGEGERRVVGVEEEEAPKKVYTMEEIDRMMDEAELEEQAELEAQKKASSIPKADDLSESTEVKTAPQEKDIKGKAKAVTENIKERETELTAKAGEGLSVGTVNGEELLAKLVDGSKHRYNPLDGTWVEEDEDHPTDDDVLGEEEDFEEEDDKEEAEEEEEEDQYGRTRGYLVPPHIFQKSIPAPSRRVKFSSFEKPATPSFPPPVPPTSAPYSTSALGDDIKNKPLPLKPALKSTTAPTSNPFVAAAAVAGFPPSPNPSFATFSTTGTFSNPSSPDPQFSPTMSSPNPSAFSPLIRQSQMGWMASSIVERQPQQIDTQQKDTKVTRKISRFKAARQGI